MYTFGNGNNNKLLIINLTSVLAGRISGNVFTEIDVRHKTPFMRQLLLLTFLTMLYFSCKKESTPKNNVTGQWIWTINYAGNPAYNSTPQSTGVNEILTFNSNGNYAITQNGITANAGTYHLSNAKSLSGQNVPGIYYTNSRVTDSVAYYTLQYNNDSLFFTYDLIGTVGSGARHYGRQ